MAKHWEGYLCFKPSGRAFGQLASRMTKTRPGLHPNEIAVSISVELPDGLFDQPQLSASITIPEDKVGCPTIAAEVVDNIQEVVQEKLGVALTIAVVEPTKLEGGADELTE